jgi:hypothetical protein
MRRVNVHASSPSLPVRSLSRLAAAVTLAMVSMGSFPGIASAVPGSQLWATRYNGPGNSDDGATALGVSPDGSTVFVTGTVSGSMGYFDYGTVALDASTGTELWAKRYNGPANSDDYAEELGVSPDGSKVFVTGESFGSASFDFATVAYDASTGAKLWAKRYSGPGSRTDYATALGVSPDGSEVFVTGVRTRSLSTSDEDYTTVAYDASTGAELWAKRYDGPGNGIDEANALGVSDDGSKVFVTGGSFGSTSYDYATVAYDAHTGDKLWSKRYRGAAKNDDGATALGVSPDGSAVFVTGRSPGSTSRDDYATVAYNAPTGAELWAVRYNGPGNGFDVARALGVSPDGSEVFVTGVSKGSTSRDDYATVAFDALSGAKLWVRRYNGPGKGDDSAYALEVSPDGSQIIVAGESLGSTSGYDYATVAYDTSTGAKLWARRYNGPGNGGDFGRALGLTPGGSDVFVTGGSLGSTTRYDYATVAYSVV